MTALAETVAEIRKAVEDGLATLRVIENPSEADTQDQLIVPVLEALGYPKEHTRRHVTDGGNYPDRIVWPVPVARARERELPARFIVDRVCVLGAIYGAFPK